MENVFNSMLAFNLKALAILAWVSCFSMVGWFTVTAYCWVINDNDDNLFGLPPSVSFILKFAAFLYICFAVTTLLEFVTLMVEG